jgi:hypothetical protein
MHDHVWFSRAEPVWVPGIEPTSSTPWGLDPSTVTKMGQRPQRAGKVIQTTDPADRCVVLVEVAEGTRALRPEIGAAQNTLDFRSWDLTPPKGALVSSW